MGHLPKGCKQFSRLPWKRGSLKLWRPQHGDHSSGDFFLFFSGVAGAKEAAGPTTAGPRTAKANVAIPCGPAPPCADADQPTSLASGRAAAARNLATCCCMSISSLCAEGVPLLSLLRPTGPRPAVLQEPPGPPKEPPQSSLSAKAPAFQPGQTWQKQVATPEQDTSTYGVFAAPAAQGNRAVLQQLPQQRNEQRLRAQCPVPAAQWPQHSNAEPRPQPRPQRARMQQGVTQQPPQPAARHETPLPTRRPEEPGLDLHWHHADAKSEECPHAQHHLSTDRVQWRANEEWERHQWPKQDWSDWQQEWRGESWGEWAARSGRHQGGRPWQA